MSEKQEQTSVNIKLEKTPPSQQALAVASNSPYVVSKDKSQNKATTQKDTRMLKLEKEEEENASPTVNMRPSLAAFSGDIVSRQLSCSNFEKSINKQIAKQLLELHMSDEDEEENASSTVNMEFSLAAFSGDIVSRQLLCSNFEKATDRKQMVKPLLELNVSDENETEDIRRKMSEISQLRMKNVIARQKVTELHKQIRKLEHENQLLRHTIINDVTSETEKRPSGSDGNAAESTETEGC